MHSHINPTITRERSPMDSSWRVTVKYPDGCEVTFLAPSQTQWNGGWPVLFSTPHVSLWGNADIDAARREAFPERR